MTVADLEVGDSGLVTIVGGPGEMWVRLMEMGFIAGVEVHVIKRAPLGDPLELRLRGYHVSLRKAEAANIGVDPPRAERGAE
jgi:ferrous iron transport protein A